MSYSFDQWQETHPTPFHPSGIIVGDNPYITRYGLALPDPFCSAQEFNQIIAQLEAPQMILGVKFAPQHLARISINLLTGCWELPVYKDGKDIFPVGHRLAGQNRARYGQLRIKEVNGHKTNPAAHIAIFLAMGREIPEGYYLDHLCENKACCYHRHVEPVTPADNTRRSHEAGILASGQNRLF